MIELWTPSCSPPFHTQLTEILHGWCLGVLLGLLDMSSFRPLDFSDIQSWAVFGVEFFSTFSFCSHTHGILHDCIRLNSVFGPGKAFILESDHLHIPHFLVHTGKALVESAYGRRLTGSQRRLSNGRAELFGGR